MKNILRDKANSGILEGFLTELIGMDVKIIAILSSDGNIYKINRMTIKALINSKEVAAFVIQYADMYDFTGGRIFNPGNAIAEHIESGDGCSISKVYMVGIVDFETFSHERDYLFFAKKSGFKGIHFDEAIPFSQKRGFWTTSKVSVPGIHPQYYLIMPKNFDDDIRTRFDEWVYALKNRAIISTFEAAGIKEAAAKMDTNVMLGNDKESYERHLWNRYDIQNIVETAEMKGEARGEAKAAKKWEKELRKKEKELAKKDAALAAALAEIERLKNTTTK